MANVYNNGTMIGYLASTPKTFTNEREGQDTTYMAYLSISSHSQNKNANGEYYWETISFRYYLKSSKQKDFLESLTKGRQVMVSYRLHNAKKAQDNGNDIYEIQPVVTDFETLESPNTQDFRATQKNNASNPEDNSIDISDDDMPF